MMFEILALVGVVMLLGLTVATIWSRKNTWVRGAAVAIFMAAVPVIVGVGFSALSHPAPYQLSIVPDGKYRVRGVKLVQDKAIYLLLDFDQDAPRYFSFPWSNKLADKIQRMMNQRQGFAVVIDRKRKRGRRGIRAVPIYRVKPNVPKSPPAPVPVFLTVV